MEDGQQRDDPTGGPESAGDAVGHKLKPAAQNPWYVLATIHGEQKAGSFDWELHKKNRRSWNRWMAPALDDEARQALVEKHGVDPDDLVPFDPEKLAELTALLAGRPEGVELPDLGSPDDPAKMDFSRVEFPADFRAGGFVFPGQVRFDEAVFRGMAVFEGASFQGAASFAGATFRGAAHFSGVTFGADAFFVVATFRGDGHFGDVTFRGGASFEDATFRDRAWFWRATFQGRAWFKGTNFRGWAEFKQTNFRGGAEFPGATFRSEASLEGATFRGRASFETATFRGWAEFKDAIFRSWAVFGGATFRGQASFWLAIFRDRAWFRGATFRDRAVFKQAIFRGEASFEEATFRDRASFEEATFRNEALFGGATFRYETSFSGTNFRGMAGFGRTGFKATTDFNWVEFDQSPDFRDAKLPFATTWLGVTWPTPTGNSAMGDRRHYAALRHAMDTVKLHDAELDFFVRELQAKRFADIPRLQRLAIDGYLLLADGGRSFGRPALAWLLALAAGFVGQTLALAPTIFALPPLGLLAETLRLSLASAFVVGAPIFDPRRLQALEEAVHDAGGIDGFPLWLQLLQLAHAGFSALCLFLMALAIRNWLRLR